MDLDLTREEFINLTPDEFQFVFNRRRNYIYKNLSKARRERNVPAITKLTGMLDYLADIKKERSFNNMKSSLQGRLQGRDPVLYDPVQNQQYNEDQHFQYLRQKYINEGSTVPFEREDYNEMIQKMEREKETAEAELKRQKAEKQQEKLNRPPTGRGLKGGKLATPVLKGLLDASYDSKVKNVGDFEIDKQLSSSTSKVYRNPKTGQVVVAHRGTAGITDWGNNAVYAIGGKEAYKLTSRYKQAEKVQRRAEKKYGAENVSTIGHSQGGLQSELLGGRSKEIITLNKATLPFESNKNKNQYDIRSDRDIVSGLNPFAKKSKRDVTIKAETYNPLTEHSGDVLDRLGKNRVIGKGVYLKGYSRMRGGVVTPTNEAQEEPEEITTGLAYTIPLEMVDIIIDFASANNFPYLNREMLQMRNVRKDTLNRFQAEYLRSSGDPNKRNKLLQAIRELRKSLNMPKWDKDPGPKNQRRFDEGDDPGGLAQRLFS